MPRPPDGSTTPTAPLYEARFEHDACGVGFVADVSGTNGERVLPLALTGLAALAHRGAVAADGASSDGAGVALPLAPALLERIGLAADARVGVLVAFLPRGRSASARSRAIVEAALAREGIPIGRWRTIPTRTAELGPTAAASRPAFRQAIVARPDGMTEAGFEIRLVAARRRMEAVAREAGLDDFAIASSSCRTIVYKGLVAGARLGSFFPDLGAGIAVPWATFHQRYATNTQPSWRLAQPFRVVAHNGEINTVRGNREQLRGRRLDSVSSRPARRLADAGPAITPDGSDSLSFDEVAELLALTGWSLPAALLAMVPEAISLRREANPLVTAFGRRTAGFLAPWDGPAALVWADGPTVGALLDRNGLRPAAFARTSDGLVAVASEAGAVPLPADRTIRRGRLGPGEMLLVDTSRGLVLEDVEAKVEVLRRSWVPDAPRVTFRDDPAAVADRRQTKADVRSIAGLDAERFRLDVRTMVIERREPLWSMGDDTPTPGRGRVDRPVVDHLRQAFAQVTNPPIDPERERAVLDLGVELGRRPPLLGGMPDPRRPSTLRLARPFVADASALVDAFAGRVRWLDTTWDPRRGRTGLAVALERLAVAAVRAARAGTDLVVVSDRRIGPDRLGIPSVLAVGRVHTALTDAGLRGRTDVIADAADVLDVHAAAMALAVGATVVAPRLAVELAAEIAGSRGAETLTAEKAVANMLDAYEAGLRKILARMGIGTAASYVGCALFETIELAPEITERCFPAAPTWPGSVGFEDIAERLLRRRERARTVAPATPPNRLADPGLARFRGDGELHLFAPAVVGRIQELANDGIDPERSLAVYRAGLARDAAVVRDQLGLRRSGSPRPLDEVESASSIIRRFVASAMSVGALSPEAHQAVTIGIQRAGGAANTGEGGEDPAWYDDTPDGRRDARIKQVASARFGVTARYLTRAEQLEIKIAQGSKPGEGGHLPGRKATAWIAGLRRGLPGQDYISPPPHHDIYSIEDLAQLIVDLRAINPQGRIGVKLVATRGIGTIAAGVAKAGADYIHVAGHAGGTGASPLSSIKHAGAPWELGLAEAHQVLLRNGLRDQVALRVDGGLQTGRDVVVAALLGAEEYGFGTSLLVALGCDMARQCHLDTCPTGIATQRDDLRAKFTGSPDQVERFVTLLAEDVRRELAAIGARSIGDIVGMAAPAPGRSAVVRSLDLAAVTSPPPWHADDARRADPRRAATIVRRRPASRVEDELVERLSSDGTGAAADALTITTAERTFGARLSGAIERGEVRRPLHVELRGSAGQSFGAFATDGLRLSLTGVANDHVGKGLSGGTVVIVPEPELAADPAAQAIAGNTCLYGATAGRVHLVGRAGMRFAIRNSGATAVVEGIGPHGCEYMTGGIVVVLGPIGANFGAGMTGGRAFVLDMTGRHASLIDQTSVSPARLATVVGERPDGESLLAELVGLMADHAAVGSPLAERLLAAGDLADRVWLVEPKRPRPVDATQPQPTRTPLAADGAPERRYGGTPTIGASAPLALSTGP